MVSKKRKKTKHILILGGAGFLGANLVRRVLRAKNTTVTVVDSLDPAFKSTRANLEDVADAITFIRGDIRDDRLLKKVVPGKDIIFNCAAQTSHPRSLHDAIFDTEINCIGTLKLLDAVKMLNPNAVIVYPSSSTVIGKSDKIINEDHVERPLEIYSANKGVAEKYHRIYHTIHNLNTIVLRFGNIFGPYGKNHPDFGFANYFIQQAVAGKTLTIYGDGRQKRNLMFVDDAVEIMWRAAHEPQLVGNVFFAAHTDHHSVADIARAVARTFKSPDPQFIPWPDMRKRIEVENIRLSSARLTKLIGWKPRYSLEEGLRLTRKRIQEA